LKVFYERYTRRPGAAERVREHGEKLARDGHPNLVRVFEVGEDAAQVFYVEEFVTALTLDKLVAAVRKHAPEAGFPIDQMTELVRQVCGLLHERPDLPHFGLHPQNVFMSKQGVKVSDLGIAGALRPVMTEKDFATLSGAQFWAPEFRTMGVMTGAADVFSLGRLLLYIMTLGEFGAAGTPLKIKGPHPRRLLDLARDAADSDPDLRPASSDSFYSAFELALGTAAVEAPAPAAAPEAAAGAEPVEEITEEDRLAAAAESAMDALTERAAHPSAEEAASLRAEVPAAPVPAVGDLLPAEQDFFGATPAAAKAERPPRLWIETKRYPPARPAGRGWLKWLVAAVVLAAAVGYGYYALRGAPPPPATRPQASAPAVDPNVMKLDGVTFRREQGGPTFQEMVEAMLTQADANFKSGQVTDPADDSAYSKYNFVLELDPKNAAAREGIKKIENYYVQTGHGFIKTKKYKLAEWSFRKALYVNAENTGAKHGLEDLAKLMKKQPAIAANQPPAAAVPPAGADVTAPPPPKTAITAADIKATINSYMGRIKFCYAQNPDAKGVVTMKFVVNPDGSVSDIAMAESTIGNPEIEECLKRRVSVMRFPTFLGSAKTITFPFRFNQ
jgi:hypothetical protein